MTIGEPDRVKTKQDEAKEREEQEAREYEHNKELQLQRGTETVMCKIGLQGLST